MAVQWPWRRRTLPASLSAALEEDEHILAVVELEDGTLLAASRFGLWHVSGDTASRTGWQSIAKARLTGSVLTVIPTRPVGVLPDGTAVVTDDPAREFVLANRSPLTDIVHTRVRRSVAASRHLPYPGGGGWVVLRRVPGRDGVVTQLRLDRGANPAAPGLPDAVLAAAAELQAGQL